MLNAIKPGVILLHVISWVLVTCIFNEHAFGNENKNALTDNNNKGFEKEDTLKINSGKGLRIAKNIETSGSVIAEGFYSAQQAPFSAKPPMYYRIFFDQETRYHEYPIRMNFSYNSSGYDEPNFGISFDVNQYRNELRNRVREHEDKLESPSNFINYDTVQIKNQLERYSRELNDPSLQRDMRRLDNIEKYESTGDTLNEEQVSLKKKLERKRQRKNRIDKQKESLESLLNLSRKVSSELPDEPGENEIARQVGMLENEIRIAELNKDTARLDSLKREHDFNSKKLHTLRGDRNINAYHKDANIKNLENTDYLKNKLYEYELNKNWDKRLINVETLSLGRVYANYTPYTLEGASLKGGDVAAYSNPLYLAVTAGNENSRNQLYPNESRSIRAFKAGYGHPEEAHFHLAVVKSNINQEEPTYFIRESEHLIPSDEKQFYTTSLSGKIDITQELAFTGEFARSGSTISESGKISNAIRSSKSMISEDAVRGMGEYNNVASGTNVQAESGLIGSAFENPALTYFRNNLIFYKANIRQSILQNQVNLISFYKYDRDNLEQSRLMTTESRFWGGGVDLNFRDWPYLSARYTPYEQLTFDESAVVHYSRADLYQVNIGYQYYWRRVQMQSSINGTLHQQEYTGSNFTEYRQAGFSQYLFLNQPTIISFQYFIQKQILSLSERLSHHFSLEARHTIGKLMLGLRGSSRFSNDGVLNYRLDGNVEYEIKEYLRAGLVTENQIYYTQAMGSYWYNPGLRLKVSMLW